MVAASGLVWMIDHTRAFKVFGEIQEPGRLGIRCDRGMLEKLRALDEATLTETMKDVLNPDQVEGLLGRRDQIVAHFDDLLSKKHEILVLFDLPPRI